MVIGGEFGPIGRAATGEDVGQRRASAGAELRQPDRVVRRPKHQSQRLSRAVGRQEMGRHGECGTATIAPGHRHDISRPAASGVAIAVLKNCEALAAREHLTDSGVRTPSNNDKVWTEADTFRGSCEAWRPAPTISDKFRSDKAMTRRREIGYDSLTLNSESCWTREARARGVRPGFVSSQELQVAFMLLGCWPHAKPRARPACTRNAPKSPRCERVAPAATPPEWRTRR